MAQECGAVWGLIHVCHLPPHGKDVRHRCDPECRQPDPGELVRTPEQLEAWGRTAKDPATP